jgi:RimJ/RimL family protein N-acetyltransferase
VVTGTRLRPARPDEVVVLQEWSRSPTSPFEDFTGDLPPGFEPGLPPTGGRGELAVTDADDRLLGSVSWHPVLHGPNPASAALDIGISLQPFARGQGHGSRAQRLLAEFLFATTPVHRVQASTDVANEVEQRALERAGFTREGVLRGAQWRRGGYHDLVAFARLRTDD